MWWQEFHFLRWYWLLFLCVPCMLVWKNAHSGDVLSSWAKVCDENLLKYLLIKGKNKQRRQPFLWAASILFLAIICLAGPTWQKKDNPSLSVDNPIMFVLNMSSDMYVKDVAPNRMVRAKYVIKDILHELKNAESGLLVYTNEPFVITPLTDDVSIIDNILYATEDDIMPEDGDRLDRAIDLAVERMKTAGYTKGNIIVISSDVGERLDAALESAAKAKSLGFDVHIIKVSGQEGEKLKMVAEKGRGMYLSYKDPMYMLTDKLNDIIDKKLKQNKNMQAVWVDMGYKLFWLPALMLLYYFRKGLLLAILVLIFTPYANAGWFLNNNQEGMRYFKQQQYEDAAQKFEDKKWRGAAAYKSGDYEKALKDFSQYDDATSLYNQGNALAKVGKIKEAIAKYEKVLEKDANFEDARFNLEYLKKQQQQQNQEQKNQQQQEEGQKDNQQQQNQGQNNQQQQEDNQQQQEEQEDNQQQQEEQQKDNQQQQKKQDEKKEQQKQQEQKQDKANQQQEQNKQQQAQENKAGNEKKSGSQQRYEKSHNKQTEEQKDAKGSKDENQQSESSSTSEGKAKDEQRQKMAADGQDKEGDDESVEVEQQARYGKQDEQSEMEAKALQTQAGAKSSDEDEQIRMHLQKFREIKEDKGGLLRSFIQREYNRQRYKND